MVNDSDELIRAGQLAHQLRLPVEWLEAEARAGRLPHINAMGWILFNATAVRRVLAARAASEGLESCSFTIAKPSAHGSERIDGSPAIGQAIGGPLPTPGSVTARFGQTSKDTGNPGQHDNRKETTHAG